MELVPLNQIPRTTIKVPLDNLSKVYNICQQMQNICEKENGIGLSAVQVGLNWKLFVVKYMDEYEYYINCEYIPENAELHDSVESCLSLKNSDGTFRSFLVRRWSLIQVKGQKFSKNDLVLEDFSLSLPKKDTYNIVFQHEIDHQNGVMISDIGKEISIW